MELQPPTAPLDAFFAPVRRRHPDVDLVVLPPEHPAPPRAVVADEAVARALDRVQQAAEEVWTASRLEGGAPGTDLAYGPADGTVVARSRVVAHEQGRRFDAVRAFLDHVGWQTRLVAGPVTRLTGARGGVRVRASYAEESGALLVEVCSEPLLVGPARARALVRS